MSVWVTYNLSDKMDGVSPVYVIIRKTKDDRIEILSMDGKNYMWSDSEKALTNRMLKMSAEEIIPAECDSTFTYYEDMVDFLGGPKRRTTSVSTKRQYEFQHPYQDYEIPASPVSVPELPVKRKAYEYSKSTYEFVKGLIIKKTLHSTLLVAFESVGEPDLIYTAPNEKEAIAICTSDTGLLTACVVDMNDGDIQVINSFPIPKESRPESLTYNEEDGGLYMTIGPTQRKLRCRDPFMDISAWEEFNGTNWESIKDTITHDNTAKQKDDRNRDYEIVCFGDSTND